MNKPRYEMNKFECQKKFLCIKIMKLRKSFSVLLHCLYVLLVARTLLTIAFTVESVAKNRRGHISSENIFSSFS